MKKGETVHWKYGRGTAEGKIKEKFVQRVTRKIKGSEITRNANKEEPAYLIEQINGNEILRSESELKAGKKE